MIPAEQFLGHIRSSEFKTFCQSICDDLRQLDHRYDWVGIYWLNGEELHLGPWSGRHATDHTVISVDEGICGAAIRENQTIIIDDVRSDPRYLACFLETRSEIVVPIRSKGKLIGEIDIDGVEVAAYGDSDRKFLQDIADEIGKRWPGNW